MPAVDTGNIDETVICCFYLFSLAHITQANTADQAVIHALQEYLDFTTYASASVSVDQLDQIGTLNILYIDTRNPGQYQAGY